MYGVIIICALVSTIGKPVDPEFVMSKWGAIKTFFVFPVWLGFIIGKQTL